MKRSISILLTLAMCVQLLLSSVTVFAENEVTIKYEAPESPAVTYNMNLDWKCFETHTDKEIWTAMALADKDGKKFYEKDYDDSEWETVSIPHAINGDDAFMNRVVDAGGGLEREVILYRKTFTVPQITEGGKVFFELEGIRQAAYVWVNGQEVGYYEAGITAFGFDITSFVTPGEAAVIAICEDGTTGRGTSGRIPYETVPGEPWGSSYTPDNYKTAVGAGAQFQWNTKDFNEPQLGLIYDAYLYVTGAVYQTLPLYNNLKTTGTYIYADNFDIRENAATIHVKSEVRNESDADGVYTLEVAVVDADGMLAYNFESETVAVKQATDKGVVYETAVESDVYSEENLANSTGITQVNTPDVTYIEASYEASDVNFWSIDTPYLYTVYTILRDADGNAVDVKKEETGFRKVTYDKDKGVLINDKAVWLRGYAQRSTNEWAVIGSATDWLQDYDMDLLKKNNANFIRWMHVAPKPAQVRSSDRYGVAVVVPAGDKEADVSGRQWSQRAEAMRDAMIYFRNSPSVIFWETGNNSIAGERANDMVRLREAVDPNGMRFMGARSTANNPNQLNYEYNYAGTMYGNHATEALKAMATNNIYGPIMETEYARDESPRRVWDDFSPPDYDYVNKWLGDGAKKTDDFDIWDLTQEDATVRNVKEYGNGYYLQRAGGGTGIYSAAAMMVWSDSNMHGRNSGSENCRTTGRVDPVRQTKEMYNGMTAAQADGAAVDIIGHWSYPQLSADTYNYFDRTYNGSYWVYDSTKQLKRDPINKTVYAVGSADVDKIELYRVDGETETLIGTDNSADGAFVYAFPNVDVTQGDAVIAKAYDARGNEVATDRIDRTYDAVSLRLTPNTAIKEVVNEDGTTEVVSDWRADGADIAYFDVEVIDENGNVCALNYDKITFTYEGEGVYLGGYNSGNGAGCFQNTAASTGISNYFGGAKDGVSTIRKDYVYAENGTNRIFVKSTRNAGSFTLTATMDGMMPVSKTITSNPIESEGGLTLEMPATLDPGTEAPEPVETVPAMKPIMELAKYIDWAGVKVVTSESNVDYYETTLNGEALDVSPKSRVGINDFIFGPIVPILDAVKAAGAIFEYTYGDVNGKMTLSVTADGHTYSYVAGENLLYIDGFEAGNSELTEDMPIVEDGVMIAQLSSMLARIPGVSYNTNRDTKTFEITYTAQ